MFKRVLAAGAFLAAVVTSAPAFAAQQDFTLINSTGYTLTQVFVSPSRANDWEEDVMGQDTLGTGQRVNIHFDRGTDACMYDLKVVYDDGETAEWNAFDLCKVSVVNISYNRSSGETSATYE